MARKFTGMSSRFLDDEELRQFQRQVHDNPPPAKPEQPSFHYRAGKKRVWINGQSNSVVWSMKVGKNKPKPVRATCRNGHELTPDNVYHRKNGYTECKQCVRDRVAKSRWISSQLKLYQPDGWKP